jgi:hypothetical protein
MSASAIYFLQQEPVCYGEELTLPAVPPSINTFSEAILPNIKMEQPLENFNALKHFLPNSNSLIFQALNLPQALPLPIFSKFSSFPLLRAYALSSSLNNTYVPFLLNTPKFSFGRILPCLPAASTPFSTSPIILLSQEPTANTILQLPHLPRHSLHVHQRALLPPQASLHLPLRPLHRIQHHLPPATSLIFHHAPLRLHGVRHLYLPHQGHLLRLPRHAEPRQAERRAARRHESHDQEHRGPVVPR